MTEEEKGFIEWEKKQDEEFQKWQKDMLNSFEEKENKRKREMEDERFIKKISTILNIIIPILLLYWELYWLVAIYLGIIYLNRR